MVAVEEVFAATPVTVTNEPTITTVPLAVAIPA